MGEQILHTQQRAGQFAWKDQRRDLLQARSRLKDQQTFVRTFRRTAVDPTRKRLYLTDFCNGSTCLTGRAEAPMTYPYAEDRLAGEFG